MVKLDKSVSRVRLINSTDDCPSSTDAASKAAIQDAIDDVRNYFVRDHRRIRGEPAKDVSTIGAWAQIVISPELAKRVNYLSDYIVNEMPWALRVKERELMIMRVAKRFGTPHAFRAHYGNGLAAGLTAEAIGALDFYEKSSLFTDEQRTMLRFTDAAIDGKVPDAVFEEAKKLYGEKELVEFIVAVAYWSFWCIILNTTEFRMPQT